MNEDEYCVTHSKNEINNHNDPPDEPKNEIKQEGELEEYNHTELEY